MKELLLFAGTSEGRELTGWLAELPVRATVCVATAYGEETLEAFPREFILHTGRLNRQAMTDMMMKARYCAVVDATHPYAAEASKAICGAAAQADIPYLRLRRGESAGQGFRHFSSERAAALALVGTQGNVLLTTGSKKLADYTGVPGFAERMFPRVLPTVEAIENCLALGFRSGRIIAMQGPFSYELNRALIEQFDIRWLVTKDGGARGGFPEKVEAARSLGVEVLVIDRPRECEGLDMEPLKERIMELLGVAQ